MAGGKKARGCEAPIADQEAFIRENAIALVRQKDAKIIRLRERITLLEKSVRSYKRLTKTLQGMVTQQAKQLNAHDDPPVLPDDS